MYLSGSCVSQQQPAASSQRINVTGLASAHKIAPGGKAASCPTPLEAARWSARVELPPPSGLPQPHYRAAWPSAHLELLGRGEELHDGRDGFERCLTLARRRHCATAGVTALRAVALLKSSARVRNCASEVRSGWCYVPRLAGAARRERLDDSQPSSSAGSGGADSDLRSSCGFPGHTCRTFQIDNSPCLRRARACGAEHGAASGARVQSGRVPGGRGRLRSL